MSPSVTVMVPSYNYERYLTECVESATSQEGVELDVVIVENASTDGSLAVARQLADKYDTVRLVEYADNQGIITSLNRCRQEVRGDYALLLCADDCLTPGALARSVSYMEAHPEVGLTYGPAIDFAELREITPERLGGAEGEPIRYAGTDWIDRRCKAGSNPIRTPEALMRSSTIGGVGLLDPATPHCSDLNMWLRIGAVADVAFLPGPALALYRKHQSNYSNAYLNWALPDLEERWKAFDAFFARIPDRPERRAWERDARHAIGSEARYLATRVFVRKEHERVQQYLEFADRIDPDGASTIEELAWRLRRKLGADVSRWFPPFMVWPAVHRFRRSRDEKRRLSTGL